MADKHLTKKSGGNKKKGRNLKKCAAYESRGQRERNKEARAKRIAKGFRKAA